MKTLELRQIDKQPIAERCYVKSHSYQTSCRLTAIKMIAAVLAWSLWIPRLAFSEDDQMSQMPTPAPMENAQAGQMNTDVIAGKLAELQNQLRRIEAMLQEDSQHSGGNMQKKGDKEATGPKMGGSMPQPAAKEMKRMPVEPEKMGMMGTAPTAVMKESALPGFPGASHLYHIGSTGFFLDHSEHITLTAEQQKSLNQINLEAMLAEDTAKRKIDQAEQELWQLTRADQPDTEEIEAKISEIEKLRGDERLTFIRSVGEAAKVLTDEQRKSLIGFAPPAPTSAATTPASSPMPAGDMKDM